MKHRAACYPLASPFRGSGPTKFRTNCIKQLVFYNFWKLVLPSRKVKLECVDHKKCWIPAG